jgi:AbrB family looped-hinge helix DNA binding protein
MLVTMDRSGRIVIPKAVRDGLGLRADESFELEVDGSAIRLELVAAPSRLATAEDGMPLLRVVDERVLTASDIRSIRDIDQR